jgi:hypothetical protein
MTLYLIKAILLFYYININIIKIPNYKEYNNLLIIKNNFLK